MNYNNQQYFNKEVFEINNYTFSNTGNENSFEVFVPMKKINELIVTKGLTYVRENRLSKIFIKISLNINENNNRSKEIIKTNNNIPIIISHSFDNFVNLSLDLINKVIKSGNLSIINNNFNSITIAKQNLLNSLNNYDIITNEENNDNKSKENKDRGKEKLQSLINSISPDNVVNLWLTNGKLNIDELKKYIDTEFKSNIIRIWNIFNNSSQTNNSINKQTNNKQTNSNNEINIYEIIKNFIISPNGCHDINDIVQSGIWLQIASELLFNIDNKSFPENTLIIPIDLRLLSINKTNVDNILFTIELVNDNIKFVSSIDCIVQWIKTINPKVNQIVKNHIKKKYLREQSLIIDNNLKSLEPFIDQTKNIEFIVWSTLFLKENNLDARITECITSDILLCPKRIDFQSKCKKDIYMDHFYFHNCSSENIKKLNFIIPKTNNDSTQRIFYFAAYYSHFID